jgi:hypothetical protein
VLKKGEIKALVSEYVERYPTELVSQLLDTLKRVGFHTATKAGISVGKNDIVVPEQKEGILENYQGRSTRSRSSGTRALSPTTRAWSGPSPVDAGQERGRGRHEGQPLAP